MEPDLSCGMLRSQRLTTADFVSLSRVLLAGAFPFTQGMAGGMAIIGVAGLTDYVDGHLARRGAASRYGAIIDPAADRLFVVVVMATLLVEQAVTPSQCLVLLSRDIVTTLGAIVVRLAPALRPARLEARWSGKIVTALQFVALIGVIIEPGSLAWTLPIVALASAVSIGDYFLAAWNRRVAA